MRIWEKIKVNDKVFCQNEEYIVLEIFKDEKYATLKNVKTGDICRKPLYSCKNIEEIGEN